MKVVRLLASEGICGVAASTAAWNRVRHPIPAAIGPRFQGTSGHERNRHPLSRLHRDAATDCCRRLLLSLRIHGDRPPGLGVGAMKRTTRDRDGNRYEWDPAARLWRMTIPGTTQTRLTKYGNLRRSQTPNQTERDQRALDVGVPTLNRQTPRPAPEAGKVPP